MRKPFAAGNWKMNTNSKTGVALAKSIAEGASDLAGHDVTVAVCPPFVYLDLINKALHNSNISVGAQDGRKQRQFSCIRSPFAIGEPHPH